MKNDPPYTSTLLAICGGAVCVVVAIMSANMAERALLQAAPDPASLQDAVRQLHFRYRPLIAVSGSFGIVAGWLLGKVIATPLDRLRNDLMAGSVSTPAEVGSGIELIAEGGALRSAAARHEQLLQRQSQDLQRVVNDLGELLNAVSEGIIHINIAGRVIRANPAALQLLSLPSNAVGQPIVAMIRNVELRQMISRVVLGETLETTEVDLDDRRLLITASPIDRNAARDTSRSAVIAVADLTRIRKLEGVRRDFVANVSHELKTPLTSIHGYAETLLGDDALPAETRRQFLEVIDRNAIRLQHIVDELLDLSRIESGAWQPQPEPLSVNDSAADAWSACRETLSTDITFNGPATEVQVRADAVALRQVFSNLFDNAVRYTGAGGSITVSAQRDGDDMVTIDVIDTGAGIPRDALPRIFERFYRVDPARSREAGGTGLGLAIVKHLIESMGGNVSALSEQGRGTTIRLRLPAA